MLFVNKGEVLQNIISISQDSVPVTYNHEDFEEEGGGVVVRLQLPWKIVPLWNETLNIGKINIAWEVILENQKTFT